jgi:hypothetical protein
MLRSQLTAIKGLKFSLLVFNAISVYGDIKISNCIGFKHVLNECAHYFCTAIYYVTFLLTKWDPGLNSIKIKKCIDAGVSKLFQTLIQIVSRYQSLFGEI